MSTTYEASELCDFCDWSKQSTQCVRVIDITEHPYCMSYTSGEKLHAVLEQYAVARKKVCLSFEGITDITPSFFSVALGSFYDPHVDTDIDTWLRMVGMSDRLKKMLKASIWSIQAYYSDPQGMEQVYQDILDEVC